MEVNRIVVVIDEENMYNEDSDIIIDMNIISKHESGKVEHILEESVNN